MPEKTIEGGDEMKKLFSGYTPYDYVLLGISLALVSVLMLCVSLCIPNESAWKPTVGIFHLLVCLGSVGFSLKGVYEVCKK